jgi:ferredoxin-NADP reductase
VQLIGGGSGVVPLVAMIRSRARSASTAPFRLLYSVRSPEDVFFRAELDRLSDSVEVTWAYTRRVPEGWPRAAGRVSRDDLQERCFGPEDAPLVFVCGPTGFVEGVASTLVDLGHDPQRIKTERFGGT